MSILAFPKNSQARPSDLVHSIVSADTARIDNSGDTVGPALDLKDTFFLTASDFTADGGADGFLRHLGDDSSQAMDARIVDDLRNFLVDPPAAIDLASINIQRGHDLGLPTLRMKCVRNLV